MKFKALPNGNRPARSDPAPALEFRDVTISFDDRVVLDRVSFTVPHGEMRIIIGPSNSGKSTILKLALGLLKPDSGLIFIDGQEITALSEDELLPIRQKFGVVFQTDALFDMSVAENVAYRLVQQGSSPAETETEVRQVLGLIGLGKAYDLMPEELSGGMRRRAAIARALVGSPDMIFYDSVCAGLDPINSRGIMRVALRLRDLEAVTSLYVTQSLDEVRYLCSHYYEAGKNGRPVLRKENSHLCLFNTRILMLTDGRIIFDRQDELFWGTQDERIRAFVV
ncbi:MAG TPA: ATP-binding cassette domain-containing protein [Blastocatellia bacterium]|nr:ATP-binding cassette domain-containing protein [Blastocatellia bacterium]